MVLKVVVFFLQIWAILGRNTTFLGYVLQEPRLTCNLIGGSFGRSLCALHCVSHGSATGFCDAKNICICQEAVDGFPVAEQLDCHVSCRRKFNGGYLTDDGCYCYDVADLTSRGNAPRIVLWSWIFLVYTMVKLINA